MNKSYHFPKKTVRDIAVQELLPTVEVQFEASLIDDKARQENRVYREATLHSRQSSNWWRDGKYLSETAGSSDRQQCV